MTACCEHNRCPDRPRRRLGRFETRPWFCPQCGRLWVTEPDHNFFSDVYWTWREVPR